MSHNTLVTFSDQLWPSSELLSHHFLHPHEPHHTHANHTTHKILGPYPHPDILKPDSVPHLQYYSLMYLAFHQPQYFHLKYISCICCYVLTLTLHLYIMYLPPCHHPCISIITDLTSLFSLILMCYVLV